MLFPCALRAQQAETVDAQVARLIGQLNIDNRDAFFAAEDALIKIGAPAVKQLIAKLKDKHARASRDPVEHNYVTYSEDILVEIGVPAVKPLLAELQDADPADRSYAERVLGRIKDPQTLHPLLVRLLQDIKLSCGQVDEQGRPDYELSAGFALMDFGAPAIPSLLALLTHRDKHVRQASAFLLARMGIPALPSLIACLHNSNPAVRAAAVPVLIPALADRSASDPEIPEELSKAAMNSMIALLADPEVNVRDTASNSLAAIGEPAVEPLVATLKSAHAKLRARVAKTLGRMAALAGIERLDGGSDKKDVFAEETLNSLAREPLFAATQDDDNDVRLAAATALVEMKVWPVSELIHAMHDTDKEYRETAEKVLLHAAAALGEIHAYHAVPALIHALHDTDSEVSATAEKALVKISRMNFGQDDAKWQAWLQKQPVNSRW